MEGIRYDPNPPTSDEDLNRYVYDELQRIRNEFNLMREELAVSDFFFEVGVGSVAGHTAVNKFGANPTVGTSHETIWDQGGKYVYSSTADISGVSSTDSGDTTVQVRINGLDVDWNEINVDVTLNGQNEVTMGTSMIRVHKAFITNGVEPAGDVYIYVGGVAITLGVPDDTDDIRAKIQIGKNRTLMAVYSIPVGKTGYIVFGKTSGASGKDVHLEFLGRGFGGVFQVQHAVDFNAENYDYFFKIPLQIPAKSDLEVHALCDNGTVSISAAFDIILVDDGF